VAWCERLAAFLEQLGVPTRAVDPAVIAALTAGGSRNPPEEPSTGLQPRALFSPERTALVRAATEPAAQTSFLPPALPAETPETESVFEEIRPHLAKMRRGVPPLSVVPRQLVNSAARAAHARDAGRPPVSLILVQNGPAGEGSIRGIADSLPDGSEVLVNRGGGGHGDDRSDRGEASVRSIECGPSASASQALSLGARQARGRVVLLSMGALPSQPIYEEMRKALDRFGVGGVGPAMRVRSGSGRRQLGRAFTDEDLGSRRVVERRAARLGMRWTEDGLVRAALLCDGLCAFDREVLAAAGGVDEHFSSSSNAVAELSVRLWRMGFVCYIAPAAEAWRDVSAADAPGEEELLYDRLRIAALHFGPDRLREFSDRAARLPAYQAAAQRLAASDVHSRRATIEAVSAFSIEQYFEAFPLRRTVRSRLRAARRVILMWARRSHFLRSAKLSAMRARNALRQHPVRR
jgi:hypothetical protein